MQYITCVYYSVGEPHGGSLKWAFPRVFHTSLQSSASFSNMGSFSRKFLSEYVWFMPRMTLLVRSFTMNHPILINTTFPHLCWAISFGTSFHSLILSLIRSWNWAVPQSNKVAIFSYNAVKMNRGVEMTHRFVLQLQWTPVLVLLLYTLYTWPSKSPPKKSSRTQFF